MWNELDCYLYEVISCKLFLKAFNSEKLLPQALKQCGHDTEMVGKWHVVMFHEDYQPHRRGTIIFWDFLLVVRIIGHTQNATTHLRSIIYSYIRLGYSATATANLVAALNAASSNATMFPRMVVWNVLVYIQYELIYALSFDCIAKLKSFFYWNIGH